MLSSEPEYLTLTRRFYDENASAYAANTAGMYDTEWLERFAGLLPEGGRVLDVGCAAGRDSEWFVQRGFQVTGLDTSHNLLALARRAVPTATFVAGNVAEWEFTPGSFEGIWCSCVLLHLSKAVVPEALRHLAEALVDGGIIYILVKSGEGEGVEQDPRYGGASKFASYFSLDEIAAALGANHLMVIESTDFHGKVDEYRATERLFVLAKKSK